jgi:hypothetical protein
MGDATLSAEWCPQNKFKQAAASQEDPHGIPSEFQFRWRSRQEEFERITNRLAPNCGLLMFRRDLRVESEPFYSERVK